MPFFTQDEGAKPKMVEDLFNTYLPKVMKLVEHQLNNNGGKQFLFGNKLSIADFWIGQIYTNYFNNPAVAYGADRWTEALKNYPTYEAYGKRFAKENEEFIKNRPPRPL